MTDDKRDELLLSMREDLSEIKVKLNADYRALHGNGHPGLLHRVENMDRDLRLLMQAQDPSNGALDDKVAAIDKRVSAIESAGQDRKEGRASWLAGAAVVIASLDPILGWIKKLIN